MKPFKPEKASSIIALPTLLVRVAKQSRTRGVASLSDGAVAHQLLKKLDQKCKLLVRVAK